MKDLYTFDYTVENAMNTYNSVKEAYVRLFDELKLPYLVANADSGNMGGSLSHEFHIPSSKGEDTIISCSSCGYVHNEELSDIKAYNSLPQSVKESIEKNAIGLGDHQAPAISTDVWTSISKDGKTLVRILYPKYLIQKGHSEPVERRVSSHAAKTIARLMGIDLDTGIKNPLAKWEAIANQTQQQSTEKQNLPTILDIYDYRVRPYDHPPTFGLGEIKESAQYTAVHQHPGTGENLNLLSPISGDQCAKCGEHAVKTDTAIELAHTFHLGTRYSNLLNASVTPSGSTTKVPLEMGCHGIGVSRMISAVVDTISDSKGLNWPRVIAPFEAVIVPGPGLEKEAEKIYDALTEEQSGAIDALIDDREKKLAWKLIDADLIGYPVKIIVGKAWKSDGKVEVQCRRLNNLCETVPLENLHAYVSSLLQKL
ncbi:hypothetical protein FQN52_004318 [Onygenales sp. PD_12]|nr:hypothetical protein FQN52_004318 [Onygenales sp. PD_12]